MGFITEELLRKRSEHNDCVLSTLEEISLHQQYLEKIEHLDKYCRHLKILFLQNNLIEKIENLEKLKELEYLNLAVNCISKIENLDQCESLNKLDLTMNFIDIEDFKESVYNLSKCVSINEIYLVGNGCTNWDKHREYLIAHVPTLTVIEGKEVLKSERIKATQLLSELEKELSNLSKANIIKKQLEIPDNNSYSIEYRKKMYKEIEEENIKKEKEKKEKQYDNNKYNYLDNSKKASIYNNDGDIRICNQGKYQFYIDENIRSGILTFELAIPKHLDTRLIKVDLNTKYVRVEVKEKVTQWRLENDIYTENSLIQRSQTTGFLLIKAFLTNKGKLYESGVIIQKLDKDYLLKENTSKIQNYINEIKSNKTKDNDTSKKIVYYSNNKENINDTNALEDKVNKNLYNINEVGKDLKPIKGLNIIEMNKNKTIVKNKGIINYNYNKDISDKSNVIQLVTDQESKLSNNFNDIKIKEENRIKNIEEALKNDADLNDIPDLD